MDEDELEKLREEKMNEMQDQPEGQEIDPEEQQQQRREQIKQKAAQYLASEAKSRLGNIRAAQPDLASSIEMQIARMGEAGQVKKIDDDELKRILKQIQNEKDENQTNIKFRR